MRISVLCSETNHPIYPRLTEWCAEKNTHHEVQLLSKKEKLEGGDILFLISCHEIIGADIRSMYRHALVIHASDLPLGRGWSPMVWQILEGKSEIVVTLLEAEDSVDTGRIWHKKTITFSGHELLEDINQALFDAEIVLMNFAIENESNIVPISQPEVEVTYYEKRTPDDSRLNPEASIISQFNLLRIADPKRYPAFFDHLGYRYKLSISKWKLNNE